MGGGDVFCVEETFDIGRCRIGRVQLCEGRRYEEEVCHIIVRLSVFLWLLDIILIYILIKITCDVSFSIRFLRCALR